MTREEEKTRLLPAVQAIYGSASNKLKIKRCLIIVGIVAAVAVAGWSVWWLFFKAEAVDEIICGDTKNEAGYIKLPNKNDDHYFYCFFEAKYNVSTAPLVIWLTGGPGGSSLLALFSENGPCRIQPDLTTKVHPYSWTYEANMIWLDQPTNVGFSYSSGDDHDYNEKDVSENLYWFLQGFIKKHPEFQGREFFLTGESYAGHCLPAVATSILQKNKRLNGSTAGTKHINLQGISIGNGWTDPVIQYSHVSDILVNKYNVTLLEGSAAQEFRSNAAKCAEFTIQCQQDPTIASCTEPFEFCSDTVFDGLSANVTGRNPYDVREPCDSVEFGFCGGVPLTEAFLSQSEVQEYLNVNREWIGGSEEVDENFIVDYLQSFGGNVAVLLNEGIRVLVYVGDADSVCNWAGNKAWVDAIEWKGKDSFNAAEEKALMTRDAFNPNALTEAGTVRSFENLALVRVFNAGHMVPTHQPEASLDLINRFFKNEALA
ncbi:hypothetical protein DVH05_020644 [Phytophthora capsici]|nr:hypothetical protein DVH05_020644 [Phytophthora capsici]